MKINENNNKYIYVIVGKNIKRIRKEKGLTQVQLADLIYNVPISVDTIRRRYPIKWTYQEGIENLIVDTKIWVF